jgi:hypothetical protein
MRCAVWAFLRGFSFGIQAFEIALAAGGSSAAT